MVLSFIGSAYHGWERNKGLTTVEGTFRAAAIACGLADPRKAAVWTACSRTDARVSARRMIVTVPLHPDMNPEHAAAYLTRLNEALPVSIAAHGMVVLPPGLRDSFDARDHCSHRSYKYFVPISVLATMREEMWHSCPGSDSMEISSEELVHTLDKACREFVGSHCFQSFCQWTKAPHSSPRCLPITLLLRFQA